VTTHRGITTLIVVLALALLVVGVTCAALGERAFAGFIYISLGLELAAAVLLITGVFVSNYHGAK
jgi:hypothetical protein